jgi:intracellular sulfur oxidation DsrE/DsrF family protein
MTHNINSNNLFHFVDTVPVESLELINKQSDGYIYLKAWEPFVNNTSYSA